MARNVRIPSDLQEQIDASDRLYSTASAAWFKLLADDVTVYSIAAAEPFRGRKAYEKHFRKMLMSTKREVSVLQRDVQLLGDRAIVAQTNRVVQEGILANVRQTIIWAMMDGTWKIQHIHTTMVGAPTGVGATPKTLGAVKVLNEKIATVAAVLGVAQ